MPTNLTGETGTADSAHVRAVRDYYACVDSGQISALVDLFADDAEYHRPGYEPIVGRNQLESFYREQRIIRDGRHTLTAIVGSDDLVAVHGEFNGVLQDGSSTSVRFADFFRFDHTGRFARRDTFFFAPLV